MQSKFNTLNMNKSEGGKKGELNILSNSGKQNSTNLTQEDTTTSKLTPKSIVRSILNSNIEGKNQFRLQKYQNYSFQLESNKKCIL